MLKDKVLALYHKHYGPDIHLDRLEFLAGQLSRIMQRDRPWTAKFLHSIIHAHNGYQDYSNPQLDMALDILAHELDGGKATLVISSGVFSHIPLPPGTIIQGDVIKCSCGVHFVPRWASQKYHSKRCRRDMEYRRRRERRKHVFSDEG